MTFPSKIPLGFGNYVGAGGLIYAASEISRGWTRNSAMILKNNELRTKREEMFLEQNLKHSREKRAIHKNYKQGTYSSSVRDDLLQQIESASPIYTQPLEINPESTRETPNKFSSITLSNQQQNLNSKLYKSTIEINDLTIPYEFQEITDLSFGEVLKSFILVILFGFFLRLIINKLVQFLNTQIEITPSIKNYKTKKDEK